MSVTGTSCATVIVDVLNDAAEVLGLVFDPEAVTAGERPGVIDWVIMTIASLIARMVRLGPPTGLARTDAGTLVEELIEVLHDLAELRDAPSRAGVDRLVKKLHALADALRDGR